MPDSIVFGRGDWWWIALAFVLATAAMAMWSYMTLSTSRGWINLLAILAKVVAVAAIAFCLLEPMRSSNRPVPGANIVAAIVDNSRSMQINPPGQSDNYLARFKVRLPSTRVGRRAWHKTLSFASTLSTNDSGLSRVFRARFSRQPFSID